MGGGVVVRRVCETRDSLVNSSQDFEVVGKYESEVVD